MKRFSIERDGFCWALMHFGTPVYDLTETDLTDLAHAVADAMAEAMRGLPEKPVGVSGCCVGCGYGMSAFQWSNHEFCPKCYEARDPEIHAGEKG